MISRRTISLYQDLLDRFLQSFHRMKAFWVQMNDLDLFFRYLRLVIHTHTFINPENLVKFGLIHSEFGEMPYFTHFYTGTQMISGVTALKFTKFPHDVARL